MNWLLVAVGAQIILGTSAVFDKLLLRRRFTDPWVYTFWASVLAIFVVIFIPFFGFYAIPKSIILLAIFSGAVFSAALYFFFLALRTGEASIALPVIGGLSPLFTLLVSIPLLKGAPGPLELFGFAVLVLGSLIILGAERREFRLYIFGIALLSSFLFGVSNVLTKLVFEASPFVTGMVWQRLGGLLLVLALLVLPRLREKIRFSFQETERSNQALYLSNRIYAALGSVLVSGAIFLAHPALVDAVSSLKYAVIFLGAWLILKERFGGRVLTLKVIATILIGVGILWLGLLNYVENYPVPNPDRQISWGVTFSQKMSSMLGLDWQKNYQAIISDLKPDDLRLIAYWDLIEPKQNEWDFSDLDWQMAKAQQAGIPVILTIGEKVPRWPECHIPSWTSVDSAGHGAELSDYLERVVERYKSYPNLLYWQVENEPFLAFGDCPRSLVIQDLDMEISLVKKLDPAHSILTTDGGEIGDWYRAAKRGDVFGTTLYRKVHSDIFGYFTYLLPPGFYPWKENLVKWLSGRPQEKYLVVELGLEPWLKKGLWETTTEEQLQAFNLNDFEDNIRYAKAAGFDSYYMWGAEWWYEMKTQHNDPRFWNAAKDVIQSAAN